MENFNFKSFGAFLNQVRLLLVRGFHSVAAMPWPAVLLVCLGMSLVIAILPLALCLFAFLLIVKFAHSMFVAPAKAKPRMLPGGDQS